MSTFERVNCPDEASFHAVWQRDKVSTLPASELAMTGGALADRAAWVFIAGYQAALKQCFPILSAHQGWCSYLVSEQRADPAVATCLATQTDAGVTLQGTKSWLASAKHLRWLIVKAKSAQSTHNLLVSVDDPGVTVDVRSGGRFLSEMTAGGASFDNTPVAAAHDLAAREHYADKFVFIESRCLMVALCSHFARLATELGWDDGPLIQARLIVAGLATAELDQPESVRALLAGMNQLRGWFDDWAARSPASDLRDNWQANQQLVDMHRRLLERALERRPQ